MRVIRMLAAKLKIEEKIEDKKPRADSAPRIGSMVPRVQREPFMTNSMTFDL